MDRVERYTYYWHLRAALGEGIFAGMVWSAPDVLVKNLGAGPLEVTLLTMAPGVAQLVTLFFARRLTTTPRRQLLLWGAFLGRLPMFLLLFRHDVWSFLLLITVQSFAQVPIISAWNSLLRTNYRDRTRGALYGRVARLTSLMSGLATLGAGLWLDHDSDAVRWLYPMAALYGVASCWIFARIRSRPGGIEDCATIPGAAGAAGYGAWETVRDVLGRDRAFRQYEIAFFLYGIAFMAAITALPLFAVHELALSNTQLLGARATFSLLMVLGAAWTGLLMDRIGPASLAGFCYILLAAVMLLLALVVWEVAGYLVVQALFGLAMAGVMIVWNMGPMAFAAPQDAARYMIIHLALVGVRALIGHPVGGALVQVTGQPRYVFLFSFVFFAAGAYGMFALAREQRKQSGGHPKVIEGP